MEKNKSLVIWKKKRKGYIYIISLLLICIFTITIILSMSNKREVLAGKNNLHISNNIISGDYENKNDNEQQESSNLPLEETYIENEKNTEEDKNVIEENNNIINENMDKNDKDNDNNEYFEEVFSGDINESSGELINNTLSGESNTNVNEENIGDINSEDSNIYIENDSGECANDVSGEISGEIRKIDPSKPMVALTFDDGPDPKRTLEIIEILQENNSLATFFDIGNLMEKYPNTVKKEIESGCEVGGHTYTHANLNKLTKEEILEEITNVENAYRNITGMELKYIRPSYGNANDLVKETVKHPLINWSVDSLDWKSRNADKVISEIRKTKDLDGKIILMHSIYSSTVEATRKLVPELIEEGYQLVTVSELAYYRGYNLEDGKVYHYFK